MSKKNQFLDNKNGSAGSIQARGDISLKLLDLIKSTIADSNPIGNSQSIKIIPKPKDRKFYEFVDMGYSFFKSADAKLPRPHRKLPGIRTPFVEL